jgi:hypothetical protein
MPESHQNSPHEDGVASRGRDAAAEANTDWNDNDNENEIMVSV